MESHRGKDIWQAGKDIAGDPRLLYADRHPTWMSTLYKKQDPTWEPTAAMRVRLQKEAVKRKEQEKERWARIFAPDQAAMRVRFQKEAVKRQEVHINTMCDPDLEVSKNRILQGRDCERAAIKAQKAAAEEAALRALDPKARQAAEQEKGQKACEEEIRKAVAEYNAVINMFGGGYKDYM